MLERKSQSGKIEIRLQRHPEKKGEIVSSPEDKKISLPVEGIIQAQKEGAKLAEKFKNLPARAVIWGFTSNQPRTREADFILGQELRVVGQKMPNSKIFDASKEKSLDIIAAKIDDSVDKIVIINSPTHAVMGMREKWNMPYIEKRLTISSEIDFLKDWFDKPKIQMEAGVTPHEIAREYKTFVEKQRKTAQRLFQGRPIIIFAIGHSWELDAGIFALMGKKLSSETLDEAGGIINTMENAYVVIDEDGKGTVQYRNFKTELDLNIDRK